MSVIDPALWRSLPDSPDILARLQSGEYSLHGGVVRHAAGTEKAGQIVAHLKFPGDPQQAHERMQKLHKLMQEGFGSLQGSMDQLQRGIEVLQSLQVANLALSGLNLAVSAAGFVVVCRKLDQVSARIQAQSLGIEQTLRLVGEAHERSLLADEAGFRSALISARQYCEKDDIQHLKSLLRDIHEQYQFTRLVLQRHAPLAASSLERLDEVALLQDRLINLGLLLSHVHLKTGAPEYSQECLRGLAADLTGFNAKRVDALTADRTAAFRMSREHFSNVVSFLEHGKQIIPALSYEAELMDLEITRPQVLLQAPESNEILLLAA